MKDKTGIANLVIENAVLSVDHYMSRDPEVVAHLIEIEEDERLGEFDRAVRVGSLCLAKAQQASDLTFLEGQVDKLLREMQQQVALVPGQLTEKLGAGEGQVLHPVVQAAEATTKTLAEALQSVRALITDKVDAGNPRSALGAALQELKHLLDPKRTDSLHTQFAKAISQASDKEGPMAKAVSLAVVKDLEPALKSLRERIQEMEKHVIKAEAAAELAEQTTQKGFQFEDALLDKLKTFAAFTGAEVERCGGDNKKGDFVLLLQKDRQPGLDLRIVIEAKNDATAKGRAKVKEIMAAAMQERSADIGLCVGKTSAAFAKEIGEFDEGKCRCGPYVACTADYLLVALRLAICLKRLADEKNSLASVDASAVRDEVRIMRLALKKTVTMRKNATHAENAVAAMVADLKEMESDIAASLAKIELAIAPAVQQEAA